MSDDLLTGVWPPITLMDQIHCVERELKYRRQVYPRLIYTGKMKQGAADREIAVMTEILVTLKRLHAEGSATSASIKADYGEPDAS